MSELSSSTAGLALASVLASGAAAFPVSEPKTQGLIDALPKSGGAPIYTPIQDQARSVLAGPRPPPSRAPGLIEGATSRSARAMSPRPSRSRPPRAVTELAAGHHCSGQRSPEVAFAKQFFIPRPQKLLRAPSLNNASRKKETNMPLILPAPIAAYFAADRRDGAAVADCFAQKAVVKDEGRTYTGIAEIKRWKENSSSKYEYTSEPISSESKDGFVIVTSYLTGNFPGSPIDLRYFFRLDGDKIGSLEILP